MVDARYDVISDNWYQEAGYAFAVVKMVSITSRLGEVGEHDEISGPVRLVMSKGRYVTEVR